MLPEVREQSAFGGNKIQNNQDVAWVGVKYGPRCIVNGFLGLTILKLIINRPLYFTWNGFANVASKRAYI